MPVTRFYGFSEVDSKSGGTWRSLPTPLLPSGASGKNLLMSQTNNPVSGAVSPGEVSLAASGNFGAGHQVRDEATMIAYQVLTSTKENINMCLEILRQVNDL